MVDGQYLLAIYVRTDVGAMHPAGIRALRGVIEFENQLVEIQIVADVRSHFGVRQARDLEIGRLPLRVL